MLTELFNPAAARAAPDFYCLPIFGWGILPKRLLCCLRLLAKKRSNIFAGRAEGQMLLWPRTGRRRIIMPDGFDLGGAFARAAGG